MATLNENYLKLKAGYLFPEIGRRTQSFADAHPDAEIIKMGIGDVVRGIPRPVADAMKDACEELAHDETFRGYPPGQGYDFLLEHIAEHEFGSRGVQIETDEIFLSDGAKCDSANIQEIFGLDNVVAMTDPVYPVYCDSNVMAGRTGKADDEGRYAGLVYLPCLEEADFAPPLPDRHVDLIYLCSPNNPTGAVLTRADLARWIDYARSEQAIIIFDAAYEAYITDDSIPHSIYELDGAKDVAIEMRSYSKTAGFTGVRCGFTVVPKQVQVVSADGAQHSLHGLWNRRQSTKYNGVSYPVQRGAAACYTPEGKKAVRELVDFYLANATIMRKRLTEAGYTVFGGDNAPYLWITCPTGLDSWGFFDKLLNEANVVSTPGAGFGAAGEGYLRLSAFQHRHLVEDAMNRICAL
ncbi:MAG: LL-diaminopimelate aminotransferase [Gemmatimonadetes bacterium]|jgi:LL-diaminopimelate aminotransferase|nr:LL-diaminopimelate aminotransferase [Gemmatimonadota bacterium]MBI92778.1 LL-diaminopimelate aminotransferase [Gemmatimonadaceae bacterium]MBU09617.1 LL-diaminopimelate aminotransferase [Gemmatimonadota bacterium]MDP6983978.1 LL-diaminopimelate aminotransferase [Candidatus Latescibacterota bacterium]